MKCNICQLDKPETEFYPRKEPRQGEYFSTCKTCRIQEEREKRWANIEESRKIANEIMKRYRNKHPEKYKKAQKRWRQNNILKSNATSMVKRAVKNGKLHKPKLCEFCYQRKPLQGHHENYKEPLSVKWLCASCHKSWHRWKNIFNINSDRIKYPEKIGYLPASNFKHLSKIEYTQMVDRNIGFNACIDTTKALNKDLTKEEE